MDIIQLNNAGSGSRGWWLVLGVGIAMIGCGAAYWLWPVAGYATAARLFGWLLVAAGVVQLVVASGPRQPGGWGWLIAGGVVDLFVGFCLVRNVVLSEAVLPYFLSAVFAYWGVAAVVRSVAGRSRRGWWLSLVNGLLLLLVGYFFVEAGWVRNAAMVSTLAALAFIYWGTTLCIYGCDLRPQPAPTAAEP